MQSRQIGFLLFPGFELLDAAGPMAVIREIPERVAVTTFAEHAGPVLSSQGIKLVAEHSYNGCPHLDVLVVPGGQGTRSLISDEAFLGVLRQRAEAAELVFSVCTGSALLARAGVLDGRRATSNKMAFAWVSEQSAAVDWVRKARWVEDGKYVSASGVAAGIDAAFAVLTRLVGSESSARLAAAIEYQPQEDPSEDPFAVQPT